MPDRSLANLVARSHSFVTPLLSFLPYLNNTISAPLVLHTPMSMRQLNLTLDPSVRGFFREKCCGNLIQNVFSNPFAYFQNINSQSLIKPYR